jgi:hypothetical protein
VRGQEDVPPEVPDIPVRPTWEKYEESMLTLTDNEGVIFAALINTDRLLIGDAVLIRDEAVVLTNEANGDTKRLDAGEAIDAILALAGTGNVTNVTSIDPQ